MAKKSAKDSERERKKQTKVCIRDLKDKRKYHESKLTTGAKRES